MFFMGWFQVPPTPPPKPTWDIWRVAYKSEEELAEMDPANPGVLKEEIVESWENRSIALARAKTLRDDRTNDRYSFVVRGADYIPNPDPLWNKDLEHFNSGFYPEDDDFDDGIAQIEGGALADDPYDPNLEEYGEYDDPDMDW